MSERVTLENFDRAESDRYFGSVVRLGAFGRIEHERMVSPGNRDTLYSSGVFDLEAAPLTITVPDPGGRFMSLLVVDENLYTHAEIYTPGSYTFTRAAVGTRYALLELRFFVDAGNRLDLETVHALQDNVVVAQRWTGQFEVPAWDDASGSFIRDALMALRATVGEPARMFGTRFEADPIRHLVGCAATGGASDRAAFAIAVTPERNDGTIVHRLTVRDVPVDGFWSLSVGPNSINSVTAVRDVDGAITIQLGGCADDAPNCLPITPGWSYVVRLYRPRGEILDGEWEFPVAQPMPPAFRDAVELVLWGVPLVGAAALRHAFLHDAGARAGDIVYWSRPAGPATQLPTLHGAARYVLVMFETFHGPVILEVPPGGALAGTILDARQVPVADIGDSPRGARYLLLPPTDTGTTLSGAVAVGLATFTGYALLRAAPDAAVDVIAGLRVYPLDDRRAHDEPHLIDMTGKPFDSVVRFDDRFFDDLAKLVASEPVAERDRVAMLAALQHAPGELRLGAARAAHELLVRRIGELGSPVWPARHWRQLDDTASRELIAFRHRAPALHPRGVWLHAFVDAHGDALRGERAYTLRVPPGTPAWIATAYDRTTCSFIRDASAVEVRSGSPALVREADGSVVLDFGAAPRVGRESNFIDTRARGPWFVTIHVEHAPSHEWDLPDLDVAP